MKYLKWSFAALTLFAAFSVQAQSPSLAWPTRPVRVVLGFNAGGPSDIVMRAVANRLSSAWGQPVVIENKPGGNEIVAALDVIRQPPDGYTLVLATDSTFSLNPLLRSKLGYDVNRDFAPITRVSQGQLMLFVRPDFPASNLKDFIGYAKSNPGKLNYASTGTGGIMHLATSWLSKLYGLDMAHIVYTGVPPVLQDITASRVDATLLAAGPPMPYVQAGKLKAIAVTGPSRVRIAPQVPTFAESGYPDYDAFYYFGLAAPAGTPAPILNRIADDVAKVMKDSEIVKLVESMGLQPMNDTPSEFAAFLAKDKVEAGKRVAAANLKIE